MRRLAIYAVLAIVLAGCQTTAQKQARLDTQDHQTCRGYGLQLGSEGYANCRLGVAQLRQAENAQLGANSLMMLGLSQGYFQQGQRRYAPRSTINCTSANWPKSSVSVGAATPSQPM